MAGITNYEEEPADVVLDYSTEPVSIDGDESATAELKDGWLRITVPARSGIAVWLQ